MRRADDEDPGVFNEFSEDVSNGAAADAVDCDRYKDLDRLLRYAVLISDGADDVEFRLIAEIEKACPQLVETIAWSASLTAEAGRALAEELDCLAASSDKPLLRSLAACVRLLSLPTPVTLRHFKEHRHVGKALLRAYKLWRLSNETSELAEVIESVVFGWAALPVSTDLVKISEPAISNAGELGRRLAATRIKNTAKRVREEFERDQRAKSMVAQEAPVSVQKTERSTKVVPDGYCLVARVDPATMKSSRLRDLFQSLTSVINVPLPLATMPSIDKFRERLLFEFPYASGVIDVICAELVGRATVKLRPLLLVGAPGAGKSRFARRLGEELGVSIWRVDASHVDGGAFGGTDRRWATAEPCHPFLAISQGMIANPLVLIDELEKAATGQYYGRLWDALLGFLESETSSRYPDPALQATIDLSNVSYVATANDTAPLPGPLRDRLRILKFPTPTRDHLDALVLAVTAEILKEQGMLRRSLETSRGRCPSKRYPCV